MGGKAVVIGGSVAGLLATRVLSEYFDEVVLVERDRKSDSIVPRKGVPQGQHVHVLWSGGMDIICRYFPGIDEELQFQGGVIYDNSKSMRWFHHGVWKARVETGLNIHAQTRPLLEHAILERVLKLTNVRYLDGHLLNDIQMAEGRGQVTGVKLQDIEGGSSAITVDSDLVVDCSGRTGAVIKAAVNQGLPPPEVETVGVDIGYATRVFKPPEDDSRDWKSMVIYPKAPHTYLWGVIFPIENGNWIVTLVGVHGHYLKSDDPDDFIKFASQLDRPELHELISRATPLTPIKRLRFAGQQRRRVDRWSEAPGGLIALGDSICSLNPVYGQGMSVCAYEAAVLDECLSAAAGNKLDARFVMDYSKRVLSAVNTAWLLATSSDFMYPETTGKRPIVGPIIGWYISRLLLASEDSPKVLLRFLEVLHFKRPIHGLLAPSVFWRVVTARDSRTAT